MEITKEIQFFTEEVKKEITISRFEHSIRVAEIAFHLSELNGIPDPHHGIWLVYCMISPNKNKILFMRRFSGDIPLITRICPNPHTIPTQPIFTSRIIISLVLARSYQRSKTIRSVV